MRKIHAFSLLEILIVLAISSILFAMAYSSYAPYFIQQKRFAAKVSLFKLAAALENYFNEHNTYQQATLENLGINAMIADNHYLLKIQTLRDDYYAISATPINAQTSDTRCGTLTLNSLGEKGIAGTDNINTCW